MFLGRISNNVFLCEQEKLRQEREEAAKKMEEQAKILQQEHEKIKGQESPQQVTSVLNLSPINLEFQGS